MSELQPIQNRELTSEAAEVIKEFEKISERLAVPALGKPITLKWGLPPIDPKILADIPGSRTIFTSTDSATSKAQRTTVQDSVASDTSETSSSKQTGRK